MNKTVFCYAAVLLLGVFNGIYSSWSFVVFAVQGLWYPSFLPAPLTLLLPLSAIISGLLHLVVTGVPVAVFERLKLSDPRLAPILWLACMVVPTLQTAMYLGWL